jgi:hypothetical protein
MLAKLSYFFHRLCAKELSKSVIEELEKIAPELVCELEKIFPPGFFLSMQHLIVHLLNEAKLGGHTGPLVLSNREMSKDSSQEIYK